MNNNYPFIVYLLVMAGVTYLLRMLPLVLIKKKITNRWLLSFLHYMPYAVLTVMTVPTCFFATDNVLSACIGTAIALVLSYFGKSLITVAACACAGALITDIISMIV